MVNSNFLLGIVGLGVMGEAILARLLLSHTYEANQICVSHPRSLRRDYLEERYGVKVFSENASANNCQTLLLAVKPQQLATIAPELQGGRAELIISMLAGTSLTTLSQFFPEQPIVRTMPNTPAQVGCGVTAFSCSPFVDLSLRERVIRLFKSVGEVVEVPEKLMNAVTGLSGSGPGYVAIVIEALSDGGVAMGLPRSISQTLAIQTVLGTAQYLQQTGIHPAQLKDQVTSPGGTTIAGIGALEYHGLRAALIEAVKAATLRSGELDC